MPLVRISMRAGKSPELHAGVGDAVHRAMVETMNVPAADRFQVITEHGAADLIYDANYLDIKRTDEVIFVQVTLNAGRTVDVKKAFYRRVADLLHTERGVRPEDVLISLVEVPTENWSFGNGVAQYAT